MEKKIPLRMCIACREMKPKPALLKFVRTAEGEIVIAPNTHTFGRGAYLCPTLACIQKAEKSRGAERALKCKLPSDFYAKVKEVANDA